jgi:hypothetical protein
MDEYENLVPTRASLLSRLKCSDDLENWQVQDQFRKRASGRLLLKCRNQRRWASSRYLYLVFSVRQGLEIGIQSYGRLCLSLYLSMEGYNSMASKVWV